MEQLAPASSDHVLEVGCGPGHAVALVCSRLLRGTITAIDRSALQVEKARAQNRRNVTSGRARIETMTLADAPAAFGGRFTKVLAVNVNAFWTEPDESIPSLRALLRAGGTACLVYETPSEAGAQKVKASLPKLLSARGFAVGEVLMRSQRGAAMFRIAARKA